MTRFRQWILTIGFALALVLSATQSASADKGGIPNGGSGSACCTITSTSPDDPGTEP